MRFDPSSVSDSAKTLLEQSNFEWNSFSLGIRFAKEFSEEQKKEIRTNFQAPLVRSICDAGKSYSIEDPNLYFELDWKFNTFSFRISPVYVEGTYNKFSRSIAQTRHDCRPCRGTGCPKCDGTGKTTQESVQELLATVFVPLFEAKELIFHGAGREDVDVRMLGNGRPFIAEMVSPRKRSTDLKVLEKKVNVAFPEKILVSLLHFVSKPRVAEVKNALHAKRYRALVECEGNVDVKSLESKSGKKVEVEQFTPERVEKRRAIKTRQHWVILEKAEQASPQTLEIELQCSSGMYVKEWISGDRGRSKPSLAEWLKLKCACKELDVLEILP